MTSREAAESVGQNTAVDRERSGPAAVLADAALAEFVTDHYDRLIRLARLVCRDGGDAGDAVQRGLERAWAGRASLRDLARLRPWVDRIVVREAIRIGRSRQSLVGRLLSPSSQVAWIEPAAPGIEQASEWGAFRTAFAALSAEHRAVIALHLYAGYSIAETAELVGPPPETVRSRLRLAKDRLRRELEERGT
jgi:RNA polymerase sigma-70 factor (ECF subfamily)